MIVTAFGFAVRWAMKPVQIPQRRPGPNGLAGWLACQVPYSLIAAFWLTGHVLVTVTAIRAEANIHNYLSVLVLENITYAFNTRIVML